MNDPGIPAPTHNRATNTAAAPPANRQPARFGLGAVVATPGALALLRQHQTNPFDLLQRHVRGDWGDLDAADQTANERALHSGARLVSVYRVGGERLWIITEAVGEDGIRPASTCLLSREY